MSAHPNALTVYRNTFLSLMGLTLLTVAAAFIDMGAMSNLIAMGIAIAKALLVLIFFMHLRHSSPLVWVAVGSGVFWFAVLVAFTLADVMTRGGLGVPGS
ncbi:MAG: cytochrome c oxidase subunit 4 [Hyphomicrobiaceae bacterium]|jgi:cytochrome c oxidase subunit 4